MAADDDNNKWRKLRTYFSGRFSMFVTYPILCFVLGLVLAYFTSTS